MTINTILFDQDGVVIDSEGLADRANAIFLAKRSIEYNRAEDKPHISGRTIADGTKYLKEKYGLDGSVEDLVAERLSYRKELYEHELDFIPGFKKFYAQAQQANMRMALATSANREMLDIANARLGIYDLFGEHIYSTDIIKKDKGISLQPKPSGDIYTFAALNAGSTPSQCVVIEDAPSGIRAAHKAGIPVIALTTTHDAALLQEHNPQRIVSGYHELSVRQLL